MRRYGNIQPTPSSENHTGFCQALASYTLVPGDRILYGHGIISETVKRKKLKETKKERKNNNNQRGHILHRWLNSMTKNKFKELQKAIQITQSPDLT